MFEFHGFDLKRAVIGGLAASLVGLAIAVAVGYFIVFVNHPGFYFCIVALAAVFLTALYGKHCKRAWKITVGGKRVEIRCDDELKGEFSFSEMKELKVNGWFRWEPENASKLLAAEIEKVAARKEKERPKINVWKTRNPYLIFLHLKNALKTFWSATKKRESGSHRRVTVVTDRQKFSILLGNIDFMNTSDRREILIFDEFLSILENYAIKQKYEKITRNDFGLSPAYVKIYKYLRK